MNIFPKRVKELRLKNNFTQQQIAYKVGINQATYSGYESGMYSPQLNVLDKLANIFNVSIDYLVGFSFDIEPICDETSLKKIEKNSIFLSSLILFEQLSF